jgi:hypothetical protein
VRVVEGERGAHRGGEPEARERRLCAVMAGANGDAFPVEDLAEVLERRGGDWEI